MVKQRKNLKKQLSPTNYRYYCNKPIQNNYSKNSATIGAGFHNSKLKTKNSKLSNWPMASLNKLCKTNPISQEQKWTQLQLQQGLTKIHTPKITSKTNPIKPNISRKKTKQTQFKPKNQKTTNSNFFIFTALYSIFAA